MHLLSQAKLRWLYGESFPWREEAIEPSVWAPPVSNGQRWTHWELTALNLQVVSLTPWGSYSRRQTPRPGVWGLVQGHACLHGSVLHGT